MLRGLMSQPGQEFDRFIIDDVTNHLYRLRNDSFGLDLIGLNINRGRDHGLRPYIDYVYFCLNRVSRRPFEMSDLLFSNFKAPKSDSWMTLLSYRPSPAGRTSST